jgi:FKBP-type peptidyl-prolyl cis-trans isomerase FklB
MVPIALILFSGPVYGADPVQLTTLKDRVSYSIGLDIGNSFKKQEIDIDPDLLIMGLKDALSGEKVLLTDQEAREALIAFQEEMRSKQENRMEEIAEKNSKAGEAFLAENKKKEGVNTLPSGLQYRVLTAGTGKIPQATDTVSTHYRGTLIDGTEFDSSYKRGEPATFPVSGVIKGWTEALQLMKVGSKWQLFIPADLAYGPRGTGGTIGPNSTLIFEVELLSIQ